MSTTVLNSCQSSRAVRADRRRAVVREGVDLAGQALEMAGLIVFVTVLGTVPVIVAAFSN